MNALFNYVNALMPLSERLAAHLAQTLKVKEIKKKEFLLKEGQVSQYIFFIESGLTRCYYLKSGNEISCWFMKEGDFIISVESFFKQVPSQQFIQALEDTKVYYISYTELESMYEQFPEFNYVGRKLTEKYYALSEERLYSIRMHRASERYEAIEKSAPSLIQRVPSNMISSYLGITKETLSRIRAKKLR